MKRCSHCEFLYEDDQRFCDMDGTELFNAVGLFAFSQSVSEPAHDPAPLAFSGSVSVLPALSSSPHLTAFPSVFLRFLRSQFSLAALALLGVISSALVIGYYEYVSQAGSNDETRDAAVSLVPSAQTETTDTPTSQQEITSAEDSATAERRSLASGSRVRVGSPTSNLAANKRRAGRNSQAGEQKRGSKVTKMFKKTGRFLSKPFKKL